MHRDDFERCPRCDAGLDAFEECRRCGQCTGMLLDEGTLLVRLQEARLASMPANTTIGGGVPGAPVLPRLFLEDVSEHELRKAGEVELPCPRCNKPMTKHGLHGQIVDYCDEHGVWLDGDFELGKILARPW
jgi:Zn-finger nucleic acid-binding protein